MIDFSSRACIVDWNILKVLWWDWLCLYWPGDEQDWTEVSGRITRSWWGSSSVLYHWVRPVWAYSAIPTADGWLAGGLSNRNIGVETVLSWDIGEGRIWHFAGLDLLYQEFLRGRSCKVKTKQILGGTKSQLSIYELAFYIKKQPTYITKQSCLRIARIFGKNLNLKANLVIPLIFSLIL